MPILVHGEVWGNLYLTEKAGGAFTEEDEEAVTVLADWAAVAIANSRLYRDLRSRNDELQRANRGLEATTEIARALGGVTDVDRVLELIAKRSRALIDARATELALLDGDEVVVAAAAGQGVEGVRGTRLPVEESVVAAALSSGRAQRLHAVPPKAFASRVLGAHSALVVPMVFQNRAIGYLSALDRIGGDGRSRRRTSACCRRSPRAPRPRSPQRRRRAPRRCAAVCTPPRRSAGAGRASCTTRRCRSWPASRCCWRGRAAARSRSGYRRRSVRRSRC